MDQITVANLGVEGGRLAIYGNQAGGPWSFWTKGNPMALDENDDEEGSWKQGQGSGNGDAASS